MTNWIMNKNEVIVKTVNAVMGELEQLTKDSDKNKSANYWIDSTHNVFAFVNDNGDDDAWIEIHFELYDSEEEMIGDLIVVNTEDVSRNALLKEVTTIVNMYFGE